MFFLQIVFIGAIGLSPLFALACWQDYLSIINSGWLTEEEEKKARMYKQGAIWLAILFVVGMLLLIALC